MVYATSADVADRWRPLSPAESALAATLAEDASDMVVSRFGDVDARVLAGTLTAQTLRRVVAGMVKRAMMSPIEGVEQSTETAGPFSRGLTYSNPSANLYFTRDDVRALSPVRRRAFTVDL